MGMENPQATLGVIGGSGTYNVRGLQNARRVEVSTPWGLPSSDLLIGELEGAKVAFIARHGEAHSIPPSDVNYRANIDALKRCGVREILTVSACGSYREEMAPGHFVIVDQFLDRTRGGRASSFFGPGLVAHVPFAHPVCERLSDLVEDAAREAGAAVHRGATYVAVEGPQFSTFAEVKMYREVLGCELVGMTNLPEARLAREAEICYASVGMVTDYDCWHPDHGDIDIDEIRKVMAANGETAQALIRSTARRHAAERPVCAQGCERVLDAAIVTAPDSRDPDLVARLDAVAGRALGR